MQLQSREEAHQHGVYYAVCDAFDMDGRNTTRYTTEAEAWTHKRGSNIYGDLDIVKVDTVSKTTERLTNTPNWHLGLR